VAKLIYSNIASLDGYVEDEDGTFGWAEPNEKVHAYINELVRPIGTFLYGHRLYEVMAAWETLNSAGQPRLMQDFAEIWRAAEKIVYSKTLDTATTAKTLIERDFDTGVIRRMKMEAERDISVGGPGLAATAFKTELIDECHLFLVPIIVGGGKQALPRGVRVELELLNERRFGNGTVYVHYRTRTPDASSPRQT
jgi:dihydrofolate reductase